MSNGGYPNDVLWQQQQQQQPSQQTQCGNPYPQPQPQQRGYSYGQPQPQQPSPPQNHVQPQVYSAAQELRYPQQQGFTISPRSCSNYTHQPYYQACGDVVGAEEGGVSRSIPIQRPPSVVYNTPPSGSLGTPQIGSAMWNRTPKGHYPRSGNKNNTSSRGSGGSRSCQHTSLASSPGNSVAGGTYLSKEELGQITLVPTRPLLKALAKQCKPHAPWCVGCPPGQALPLANELTLFSAFLSPTPEETTLNSAATALVTEACQCVWPGADLLPMAATAAGQPWTKRATTHLFAQPSVDAGEETRTAMVESMAQCGGSVDFAVDERGIPCALCTDSRSGKRFCIRYGERAAVAATSAQLLSEKIAGVPTRLATLRALLALLEQNKILDESGVHKGHLSGEAVAVMLLAVVNSYSANDEPDSGRLLLDFFMTYGFQANFDFVTRSVTIKGMRTPVSKVHKNAQLDVIDPGDSDVNLTPHLDRAANLQAVFNYCYTALSQYQQISTNQRRAQSALSTIIGGEPYWGRVLMMYEENIEPFHAAVEAKKGALALSL